MVLPSHAEHLRACVLDMPNVPGVYTFHGQPGDLPVYIGKSIHLKERVLSHLRSHDEVRMVRQTQHISVIRTAGELGALLLEAQMIKQQQPLFNQKLRRNRQLCALRLDADGRPEVVYANTLDFAQTPDLFGLYASRAAALAGLRNLADAHRLCYCALGLEKCTSGRGCFRAMLKQCAGVCCGKESGTEHQARLMAALAQLRVNCWPYPGPIGLVERWEGEAALTQVHVVNNWCYLGSVDTPEQAKNLSQVQAGFDADGYKILCKPILNQAVQWVQL